MVSKEDAFATKIQKLIRGRNVRKSLKSAKKKKKSKKVSFGSKLMIKDIKKIYRTPLKKNKYTHKLGGESMKIRNIDDKLVADEDEEDLLDFFSQKVGKDTINYDMEDQKEVTLENMKFYKQYLKWSKFGQRRT